MSEDSGVPAWMTQPTTENATAGQPGATAMDPSPLAERRTRLIAEAEAAWATRAQEETQEILATITRVAEMRLAQMQMTVCEGESANIARCTDEVATACDQREVPSCPRNIAAFEQRAARDAARERLREARIPEDVRQTMSTDLRLTEAAIIVNQFLVGPWRLLVLSGRAGCGKTTAAAAALARVPGLYAGAGELVQVKSAEPDLCRRAIGARLLVLDDLGREHASDWAIGQLEELITNRYDNARLTICTTNLAAQDFGQRFGVRVSDRVTGTYGQFVPLRGKSMRHDEK